MNSIYEENVLRFRGDIFMTGKNYENLVWFKNIGD